MAESEERARAGGYLSEESKKRFTIVAGALGALFFVLQFVVPILAMFALMPTMMMSDIKRYAVDSASMHDGLVYLVRSSEAIGDTRGEASRSLVAIGAGGVEEIAELGGWEPRLLSGPERLWLISSTQVGVLEAGQVRRLAVREALGDISRPFLLDGVPAVVESRPDGEHLMAWREGGWTKVSDVPDLGEICCLQILATQVGPLALRTEGESLFSRELNDASGDWKVVATGALHWYAFMKDGKPAVATVDNDGVRFVELDGVRWMQTGSVAPGGPPRDLAAFQQRPGGPVTLVSAGFPGSLTVRTWADGKTGEERTIGKSSFFPKGMMAVMWLPQVGVPLLSLLLAIILTSLMRVHRIGTYVHEGSEVQQASLTRRALSQLVDAALLMAPGAVAFSRMFGEFDETFGGGFPLRFFALFAGAIAWAFLALVLFSVAEGLWGLSPGKWLLGIRVVGVDLRPCGVGRGLIRNVLKLADGFFNFLIGILMVAFTPDWQRLGDMAARTVVIRAPQGGLASLRRDAIGGGTIGP